MSAGSEQPTGTPVPDISVLIPVLNEAAHIRETVAAMRAQELGELTFELIFVDGDSDDDTKSILHELAVEDPRIRVLDNPQRTTACGLNVALAAARGRYVARMDAHSFFPPRYLAAGVERLGRGDGVVWVAGPVVARGEGRWSRRVALALGTRLGVGGSSKWTPNGEAGADAEFELDTGVFAGVWERSTVTALGGWDPDWPVNQDSEMAARVLAGGGRIMCLPEMAAHYLPRDDLRALWRQYWRHGLYRAKTSSRHPESLRRTHLLPPGVVLAVVVAVFAPRPMRRLARAALGLYLAILGATVVDAGRHAPAREVAGVPAVLVTMHCAWGLGFIAGWARFGGIGAAARALVDRPRGQL